MFDVLVVDDDPDIRGMLVCTLEGHGFQVRGAADGAEALQLIHERTPDAMVLDLMMPNIDGFTLLEQLRTEGRTHDIEVVILSCRSDEAALVRSWELGASDYLVKPTDPDVLAARLRSLLAGSLRPPPAASAPATSAR